MIVGSIEEKKGEGLSEPTPLNTLSTDCTVLQLFDENQRRQKTDITLMLSSPFHDLIQNTRLMSANFFLKIS
jgi:hypothetical protein